VDLGAQIIDLNMGCPAKKVCGKLCGSSLLRDESLVARILEAVVNAVSVPVTLKIRTGWDRNNRNGVQIARIAEASGIKALAVHGRTRADFYAGEAEYETIRNIKSVVRIPIFANGDIETPHKAREVLDFTGADGVMLAARVMALHGYSNLSTRISKQELRLRRYRARRCVILFSGISAPCTPSTAKTLEFGSRANISAGIANSC